MAAAMKNGIVKRGSTYSYVVRERDPATGDSKPRWKGGFKTRQEAIKARDKARAAAGDGESVIRSRDPLSDYLHSWLDALDVKPKTMDGYRYNVDHYVIPRLGATRLQDLTPQHLTRLYFSLRVDGGRAGGELGWPSVHAVHRTLRSALSDAVHAQLLHSNPAERAQLPPKPRATTREAREEEQLQVYTPSQLTTFLVTASRHRLGPLFHLAAYTGARRGELLHLRWRDLDFDRRTLHIAGSRTMAAGKPVEGSTKGGHSRTTSLDSSTLAVMRSHRANQAQERLIAGELWQDHPEYVFVTHTGAPIHLDTPSSLMPKLCAEAGLPRIRFHDLRHTHATILLSAGVPVHEVADRLGHADATITLKVYAKVLQDRASGLGDAFEAAVNGAI
jgi:integrase